jgi:hypothetical protein
VCKNENQTTKYESEAKWQMIEIRTQVFEILQDIPDDKLVVVSEVLRGLRALYATPEINETKKIPHDNAFGIFNTYIRSVACPKNTN